MAFNANATRILTLRNLEAAVSKKEYVGLVHIENIIDEHPEEAGYILVVKTLRQYKGRAADTLHIQGFYKGSQIYISSSLYPEIDQEWLFIKETDDNTSSPSVGYSKLYRRVDGFVRRTFNGGQSIVNKLDQLFGLPYYEESLDSSYSNGNRKCKINKRNGQVHGTSIYYYPSGKIHRKEKYRAGKKHGKTIEYSELGHHSYILNFRSDTLFEYTGKYKKEVTEKFLTDQYGNFQKIQYPKNAIEQLFVLKGTDQIILDTIHRVITLSKFKRDKIKYEYDEYRISKKVYPYQYKFDFDLKDKSKSALTNQRELVVVAQGKNLLKQNKVIIIKEHLSFDWHSAFDSRLLFFHPKKGLFLELRSDENILSLVGDHKITELINISLKLIEENNLMAELQ